MELKEFENVFAKSRDGDFSVRVDESRVVAEYQPLARVDWR